MMFPKKKWQQPEDSKTYQAEMPEAAIQAYVDDYLKVKSMRNIRIPDGFFRWIYVKAPAGIKRWFFGVFGGRPDNTIICPLGNGYSLALELELKTQDKKGRAVGRLHGKQKHHESEWRIARSPEQAKAAIDEFEAMAEQIKEIGIDAICKNQDRRD